MEKFPSETEAREMKLPKLPWSRRSVVERMLGTIGVTADKPGRGPLVFAARYHEIAEQVGLVPPYYLHIRGGGIGSEPAPIQLMNTVDTNLKGE